MTSLINSWPYIQDRAKAGIVSILFCMVVQHLPAQPPDKSTLSVSYKPLTGAFPLVGRNSSATIQYDTGDAKVVAIAAATLKSDISRITGISPALDSSGQAAGYRIITGTIGKSKLIDGLIKSNKIKVSAIAGKWETFSIAVVDNPFTGCRQALVITGSDPRGTAFGIFELSRMLGTSPFCWWADIEPGHHDELHITKGVKTAVPPSVKYRGIFINDEDWGLQPWAAKTFEPGTGDIGPKTYAKVFELLLRLKANMIWPAMHPSTKAFYYYPGNKQVAADYSIVIGSSHAEPMLRNNVGEWDKATMGDFNYLTNRQKVYQYWEDRVKESRINDVIYTLGMRGVHDSGIEGVKDSKDAVPLVERIFEDQRGMIRDYINKDVTKVPQAFTAYKEVLDIYDNNLKVPDDVIIVWPDDNYGYIQRLNDEKEKKRAGGAGVYFHASYWGRPHDYLWLSTTHPELVREEMVKAYESKADKLWVLNVGDIKPLEYNIQQFMDMAYNVAPFKSPGYTKRHLLDWANGIFGNEKGPSIEKILWQYYQLAFERRPEFMGWSQTEPTTKTTYTSYNHYSYGDEAQQRIDQYDSLEQAVKQMRTGIEAKDSNAFYQLVYYPVVGASLMNKKFLYRDKSYIYSKQGRLSAYDYAKRSEQAYTDIVKETEYYNTRLTDGKWKSIISMEPRKLPVYLSPVLPIITIDSSRICSIAPEGYDSTALASERPFQLPPFDAMNRQSYFVDLFLTSTKIVYWKAITSSPWIKLSATDVKLDIATGQVESRIYVTIDWSNAPKGELLGYIIFQGAGEEFPVEIKGWNIVEPGLSGYKGFIENNGIVSIYATDYNSNITKPAGKWQVLDGLGYTGRSLQAVSLQKEATSVTEEIVKKNNPYVSYDFYTTTVAAPVVSVFSLPTHPLNKHYSMRYAISIDDDLLQIVDFRTYGRSEEWKQNVLRNSAVKKTTRPSINKGKHTLKIYSIDPGVILDKIIIDLGGLQNAYSTIPETKLKK